MLDQISSLRSRLLIALRNNVRQLLSDQEQLPPDQDEQVPHATFDTFLVPKCKVIVNYYDEEPPHKIEGVIYTNTSLHCRDLISEMYGMESPIMPFSWNILRGSNGEPNRGERFFNNYSMAYVCMHRPYGWEWADNIRKQGIAWIDKAIADQEERLLKDTTMEDDLIRELLSKEIILQVFDAIAEYTYNGQILDEFN